MPPATNFETVLICTGSLWPSYAARNLLEASYEPNYAIVSMRKRSDTPSVSGKVLNYPNSGLRHDFDIMEAITCVSVSNRRVPR